MNESEAPRILLAALLMQVVNQRAPALSDGELVSEALRMADKLMYIGKHA